MCAALAREQQHCQSRAGTKAIDDDACPVQALTWSTGVTTPKEAPAPYVIVSMANVMAAYNAVTRVPSSDGSMPLALSWLSPTRFRSMIRGGRMNTWICSPKCKLNKARLMQGVQLSIVIAELLKALLRCPK